VVAKLLYSVAVALDSTAHDHHRHSPQKLNVQADWLVLINHLDISTSRDKCTQMSTENRHTQQAHTHSLTSLHCDMVLAARCSSSALGQSSCSFLPPSTWVIPLRSSTRDVRRWTGHKSVCCVCV